MPNDVSKLPKWAQDELRVLQMRVDEWKARALAWEKNAPSRVYTLDHDADMQRRYYDADQSFRFYVGDKDDLREFIEARLMKDKGGHYVRIIAGETLSIRPMSSNLIELRTAP